MTDNSTLPGYEMIVTAGQAADPSSDSWLVTGPYWEPGGTDDAHAAFSSMIEGEADALEYARGLIANMPGCKLEIWHRDATTAQIEIGTE